jgi:hypothetical protein
MFATPLQGVSASTSQNAAQSVDSFINEKIVPYIKPGKHMVFKTEGDQSMRYK